MRWRPEIALVAAIAVTSCVDAPEENTATSTAELEADMIDPNETPDVATPAIMAEDPVVEVSLWPVTAEELAAQLAQQAAHLEYAAPASEARRLVEQGDYVGFVSFTSLASSWSASTSGMIETLATFGQTSPVRGATPTSALVFPGGTIGSESQGSSNVPLPEIGAHYLISAVHVDGRWVVLSIRAATSDDTITIRNQVFTATELSLAAEAL